MRVAWIERFSDGLLNAMKNFLGIESPSRLFHKTADVQVLAVVVNFMRLIKERHTDKEA